MLFELVIKCDTKAFGHDDAARGVELGNILIRAAAELISEGMGKGGSIRLYDQYGVVVGMASLGEAQATIHPIA